MLWGGSTLLDKYKSGNELVAIEDIQVGVISGLSIAISPFRDMTYANGDAVPSVIEIPQNVITQIHLKSTAPNVTLSPNNAITNFNFTTIYTSNFVETIQRGMLIVNFNNIRPGLTFKIMISCNEQYGILEFIIV